MKLTISPHLIKGLNLEIINLLLTDMEKCPICVNKCASFDCSSCKRSLCSECHVVYNCDFCKNNICGNCSNLSSTEVRCMALKNRLLKFHCSNCKIISNYHNLVKSTKKLEEENSKLKEQLNTYTKDLHRKRDDCDIPDGLKDTLEPVLTDIINNLVGHEISQLKEEVNILKESNIDLIKLFTNAPTNFKAKSVQIFQDTVNSTERNQEKMYENKDDSYIIDNVDDKQHKQNGTSKNISSKEFARETNQKNHWKLKVNRRKKIQIGNAENKGGENCEFEGNKQKKTKKLWLFISRVKSTVTEEVIKKYISKKAKTDINNVYVKLLKTYWMIENDNNCFMVGLQFTLHDLIYDNNFWPSGVAYERFDFKRGRRFLDNPRHSLPRNVTQTDNDSLLENNCSFSSSNRNDTMSPILVRNNDMNNIKINHTNQIPKIVMEKNNYTPSNPPKN